LFLVRPPPTDVDGPEGDGATSEPPKHDASSVDAAQAAATCANRDDRPRGIAIGS
jgi:hypothetical protein